MSYYVDLYQVAGHPPSAPRHGNRYADLYSPNAAHLDGRQRRSFTVDLHTRAAVAAATGSVLDGIAVPFNQWTQIGAGLWERFTPEAFTDLVHDQPALPLLVHHNHASLPIGISTSWQTTPAGLRGRWRVDTADPIAAEVTRKVRGGYITGLSVGFTSNLDDQDVQLDAHGDMWVTRRKNVRLLEVSVVAIPAYPGATITTLT